jgi:hypothetical protein
MIPENILGNLPPNQSIPFTIPSHQFINRYAKTFRNVCNDIVL